MVDVVLKKSSRGRERLQEIDFKRERHVVRIVPRDDMIRKYIKHQPSGIGFLPTGSAEWPYDQFTKRRIADGDVAIETPKPKKENNKSSKKSEAS